ncbi:hypothetical protein LZC95_41545 [Pendulispora brunnea]|uniref:Uncharacterized protein n=1 Tax=Pendulispora brunnea TaxID=2905690 RepID=A0ABZ2K2R6_9BACT
MHRSAASAQARLGLRALTYRHVAPGGMPDDLVTAAHELGSLAGHQAACMTRDRNVDDYVVSSTILSALLADGSPAHQAFASAMARCAGRRLDWLTHAYECAGWGYVMRRALQKATHTGPRTLLLQIVDVDIHDFTYWHKNTQWGNSGFGVCSLLIDIAPGQEWPLSLGAATPAMAMVQMGRALRDFSDARPGVPVAVPFFRETSRKLLLKRIPQATVHADGYANFGHAFGSDPWISLLLQASRGVSFEKTIVNSLALYGYFAIAEVELFHDTVFRLERAS